MAITAGTTATLLRIGHKGGPLARIGLGRLAVERTLAALRSLGYSTFDFSIGEGSIKRMFKAAPDALVQVTQALTWRGQAAVVAADAKRRLGQSRLATILRQRPKGGGKDSVV